jgi:hypothetical protein
MEGAPLPVTLGLAIVPQSLDGVVVMSDSMGIALEDGREVQIPSSGKLGFIPSARTAFVISGFVGATLEDFAAERHERGFDDAVTALYESASALYPRGPISPDSCGRTRRA